MAKQVLDMAAIQEREFSDTALIGISTSLSPHKFCHEVNNKLDMDFVRRPEMDITIHAKDQQYSFHFFEYQVPLNGGIYTIYKLKNGPQFLLPELKQLDYLWKVECACAEDEAENIIQYLYHFPDIQLAQLIPTDRLKNLSHLLI